MKAGRPARVLPVKLLLTELASLRIDLRTTLRAYAARLEIDLAECRAALARLDGTRGLTPEQCREIRVWTAMVRNREVRPEKGRRKDLRKLENVIRELHEATRPPVPQAR